MSSRLYYSEIKIQTFKEVLYETIYFMTPEAVNEKPGLDGRAFRFAYVRRGRHAGTAVRLFGSAEYRYYSWNAGKRSKLDTLCAANRPVFEIRSSHIESLKPMPIYTGATAMPELYGQPSVTSGTADGRLQFS